MARPAPWPPWERIPLALARQAVYPIIGWVSRRSKHALVVHLVCLSTVPSLLDPSAIYRQPCYNALIMNIGELGLSHTQYPLDEACVDITEA